MRKFFSKHQNLWRSILFLLVFAAVMEGLSVLSIQLDRKQNPVYNYSARSMLSEPKNTIDVVSIGASDVYSGISPMEWWNAYGYTGYNWSEPAQRIFETHEYLKKIYKNQSPKVVFLEIGNVLRDKTDAQNLDSMVKAHLSNIVPLITYHRNLMPHKFRNLGAGVHSACKGYLLRRNAVSVDSSYDYMKSCDQVTKVNSFSQDALQQCIDLCKSHGSEVVLISIPSYAAWNMADHNAITQLAEKYQVSYLDLNIELKDQIDWKTDTADGGNHLNDFGAQKVTAYLGQYLSKNFSLTDHRSDGAYDRWNTDYKAYAQERDRVVSNSGRTDFGGNRIDEDVIP